MILRKPRRRFQAPYTLTSEGIVTGAMLIGRQQEAAEATFTLRLKPASEGWALVDSAGHVRAASPSRATLAANVSDIAAALLTSAQMTSRLAHVGVAVCGSSTWAVRA